MHPNLRRLLSSRQAVCVERREWPIGLVELALYLGATDLPDELVSSVRCLVQVGEQLLVCEDAHPSVHVWPGGRREPGESWAQTAVREVAEETGWQLNPESLVMLGFIHFRHLSPVPADHPYPNPDFLQVVLHGEAAGGSAGWVDTEGYVLRSSPRDVAALADLPLSQAERHAVNAIDDRR